LQADLVEEITDQIARHILIWMQPKEHLRLKGIILTKPQRNCTNS
jgi:hypothetical protein